MITSYKSMEAKGGPLVGQLTYHPAEGSSFSSTSGSFDLTLTDGQRVYVAEGVTQGSIVSAVPSKLSHALEALTTDLLPSSHEYQYELKQREQGAAALYIQWQHKDGTSVSLHFAVQAADSPGQHICGLLTALLSNVASLKASTEQLQQQREGYALEAQASQRLVREYVEKKEEHEREMHGKIAALLNSKKAKLRELRGELEGAKAGAGGESDSREMSD